MWFINGSKLLDRRANELVVENTRPANQKKDRLANQWLSCGACEGSGHEILSHKSSYVFWSGLIFLFFYITHNDDSLVLIMRMIHDKINHLIRHLITHHSIWVIYNIGMMYRWLIMIHYDSNIHCYNVMPSNGRLANWSTCFTRLSTNQLFALLHSCPHSV